MTLDWNEHPETREEFLDAREAARAHMTTARTLRLGMFQDAARR